MGDIRETARTNGRGVSELRKISINCWPPRLKDVDNQISQSGEETYHCAKILSPSAASLAVYINLYIVFSL